MERRHQEFNEKVNKRMEEERKYLDEKRLKRNLKYRNRSDYNEHYYNS